MRTREIRKAAEIQLEFWQNAHEITLIFTCPHLITYPYFSLLFSTIFVMTI